jgi:hypothetical protein
MGLPERLLQLKAQKHDLQESAQKRINDLNAEIQAKQAEVQQLATDGNFELNKLEGKIEEVTAMLEASNEIITSPNGKEKTKA